MAPGPKPNYKDRIENGELDLSMTELTKIPIKDLVPLKKAVKLDLSHNFIVTVPDNISLLNHLVQLDLSNNSLKELPESFGALVKLKHLNLCDNQLTYLPLSFCELKVLRWLDVKNNPLIPELAQIAGECSNALQCQQCAKNIVNFLSQMRTIVQAEQAESVAELVEESEISSTAVEKQKPKQKQKQEKKPKQEKQIAKNETKKNKSVKKPKNKIENYQRINFLSSTSNYSANHGTGSNKSKKGKVPKRKHDSKNIFYLIVLSTMLISIFSYAKNHPEEVKLIRQQLEQYYKIIINAIPPSVSIYFTNAYESVKNAIPPPVLIYTENVYNSTMNTLQIYTPIFIEVAAEYLQVLKDFSVSIFSVFFERISHFVAAIMEP